MAVYMNACIGVCTYIYVTYLVCQYISRGYVCMHICKFVYVSGFVYDVGVYVCLCVWCIHVFIYVYM